VHISVALFHEGPMRFTNTDRCVECGNPEVRSSKITAKWKLDAKGHPPDIEDYWFCSDGCYERALREYLPSEFSPGKSFTDHPDWKNVVSKLEDEDERYGCPSEETVKEAVESFSKNWSKEKKSVEWQACNDLQSRLWAESKVLRDAAHEKYMEKEWRAPIRKYEAETAAYVAEITADHAAWAERKRERTIPEHIRFEHTHILGPQGSGKTTLLQHLFLEDITKNADPPAYIIIDPKGLLTDRISRLDVFNPSSGRLRDRLIIIDPAHSPALNMFHQKVRPEILNRVIEMFSYIFSSANARITQRQSIPFGFVVRLVFWMGGDLNTLMDVLEDDEKKRKFAPQIAQFCDADPTGAARRFFDNDFYNKSFAATREQIRTRLFEIVAHPELAKMFLAPANNLNLFDCMQQRKIVLVNTNDALIGTVGSQFLGRYVIAMAMNAVMSRYFVPDKTKWTPVFLMADEFQEYADEDHTPRFLRMVREYKMGVIMAHQQMHCPEFNDSIRSAVSSSAIKYAASPEAADLSYMARDLRCEPSFLRQQEVRDGNAHFACFVRGIQIHHPFEISVSVKNMEAQPQMSNETHQWMLAHNAAALSGFSPASFPEEEEPLFDNEPSHDPEPGMTPFHTIEAHDRKTRPLTLKRDPAERTTTGISVERRAPEPKRHQFRPSSTDDDLTKPKKGW
jgi:hypothetical protein